MPRFNWYSSSPPLLIAFQLAINLSFTRSFHSTPFLLAVSSFFRVSPAGAPRTQHRAADVVTRRPVAITLIDGGKRLLVANRDSGTIAVVDTQGLRKTAETLFFFSSRRRHTRSKRDWSSDVCSSD